MYFELIAKRGKLLSEDFERVGRWKERCLPPPDPGRWKTGTPVGYDVWIWAKAKPPACPDEDGIAAFLKDWSERRFLAGQRNGQPLTQAFGLARATTLLHFISGGVYPILDSTVLVALTRLGSPVKKTIEEYSNSFCVLFSELASVCGVSGTEGLRKLDNALNTYGGRFFPEFPKGLIPNLNTRKARSPDGLR